MKPQRAEHHTDTRQCPGCFRTLSILQFNQDGRGGRRRKCAQCRQGDREASAHAKPVLAECPITAAYRAWLRSC